MLGAAGGYAAGLTPSLPILYHCCHQGSWPTILHGLLRYGPGILAPYQPSALLVLIAGLCVGGQIGRVYAERPKPLSPR